MRAPRLAALALLAALAGTGCVQQQLYHWRGYDDGLYRHYRNPQEREQWVETLKTVIVEAEQSGRKVPPGLYAEYGYALYEEHAWPQAIVYFEKERAKWPESAALMDKMIRNAQRQAGNAPAPARTPAAATGAASRVEGTR
jgi:hypothetical protein